MSSSRVILVAGILMLGSCGKVTDLKPAPGQSLPVKPLMAKTTPTADELLTPPPYARPERVDELMKRSEPRRADPFDLPPPTGGAAPAAPAGSDQGTSDTIANQTGVSTPQ